MSLAVEAPLVRKKYFWTTTEIAALERLCKESSSLNEIEVCLPGRSGVAIYQKAVDCGFEGPWSRSEKGGGAGPWSRARKTTNEEIDKVLLAELSEKSERGAIKNIAERLKVPAWELSRRAGLLGLTKPRLKEPEWSRNEIEIIDAYGEDGVTKVDRALKIGGYSRTPGSISNMLKRREIEQLGHSSQSARGVAEMMGVDGKTVARWIEVHGLKSRQIDGVWRINKKDLKRWFFEHPDSFDIKKVKQAWFMGVLKGQDDIFDF